MATTLNITLINDDNGQVDVQATLTAAEDQITTYKANRELEQDSILSALNTVFDNNPGVNMNMPFVINEALRGLNVSASPANYQTLHDRVHGYIQANSQGKTDKDTKMVERPESLFVIGKGKGNGLRRRADIVAQDEAARVAAAEALANGGPVQS
jgi:hypothetical protein